MNKPYFSSTNKIASVLLILILSFCSNSFSQNLYRTTNGYVLATGLYNEIAFIAESHKLSINYNPRDKTINGEINFLSFNTGVPFIDSIIADKPSIITIIGYIPVDFLTWDHAEYNLDIPLEIKLNDIKINALSKIKFSHVDKSQYICVMEASFNLNLADFNLNVPVQFGSEINILFLQLILRKGGK